MSPIRHSEGVLYAHLTNPDSLDIIAREGFNNDDTLEVIPTELGRRIVRWCLGVFFEGGRTVAPSRQAILDTFGEQMEKVHIEVVDDVETDSVQWAIADLRSHYAYVVTEEFTRQFATELYNADGPDRVDVMMKYSGRLHQLTRSTLSRRNEMTGLEGVDEAIARFKQRAAEGRLTMGLTFGLPELDEHLFGIHPREICTIAAGPGVGKRLRLDEPIPTPSGWTTMGELKVGDQVFDRHGSPCRVTALSPIEEHPDSWRVVFNDGTAIEADAEHQWVTSTRADRRAGHAELGVRTTEDIRHSLRVGSDQRANHAVPVAGALDLPFAKLPLPPYAFGVWLGNGNSREPLITLNRTDYEHYVTHLTMDSVFFHRVVSQERNKSNSRSIWLEGWNGQLKQLGVQHNKHIPLSYLRAGIKQRWRLLQGLMDTDGHIPKNGHTAELTLTNQRLATDAFELISSLGIKPTMTESRASIGGVDKGPRWRITFASAECPFALGRKRDRWIPCQSRAQTRYIVDVIWAEPTPMRCITVDSADHTYLAGRAMVPTHNSWTAGYIANTECFNDRRCLFVSLENDNEMTFDRLICMAAGVPYEDWQRGVAHEGELARVAVFREHMAQSERQPIVVQLAANEATAVNIVRRAQLEDAHSIVVDQLSHVYPDRYSRAVKRFEQLAEIMRDFHTMIRDEYAVPLVLMNQINRDGMAFVRKAGYFEMIHLAEGGAIEKYSAIVLAIVQSELMRREQRAVFQELKHRRGALKHFETVFRPEVGDIRIKREIQLGDAA